MPIVYCSCGFANKYSGTKPSKCEACGESLAPKPKSKPSKIERRYVEEPEEVEEVEEPEYDVEAIRASIQLRPEESDNKFMTVEQLRKSQVAVSRGSAPVDPDIRDEVMGTLMGTREAGSPQPPTDGRGMPRRVERLRR